MAHPDLDSLLNTCLDFASDQLRKNREFYPFGASLNQNGKGAMNAGWNGDEKPQSQDVIDLLTQGFKESASSHEIVACVICSDVKLKDSDAIRCELDHIDDKPVTVLVPYSFQNGELVLGKLNAQHSDLKIFA